VKAINPLNVLSLQNIKIQNRSLKGTGAKRDVCSGFSVSSRGAKFPYAPVGVGAYGGN